MTIHQPFVPGLDDRIDTASSSLLISQHTLTLKRSDTSNSQRGFREMVASRHKRRMRSIFHRIDMGSQTDGSGGAGIFFISVMHGDRIPK